MQRQADAQETAKPPRREPAERLRRNLERVERERERLEREVTRLHKRNRRLEDENARLKRELDAARRAGCRQAAPFAKPLSGAPKRPGRRAGAAYGVASRRRAPVRVDERHHVPLPPACPDWGGVLRPTGVATQVQEELPVPRVVVRQFEVAIGAFRACVRRVQGRHRLQSSDALGAAGVQLGPQMVAWAVILNKQLGLSFGKVATLLRQHYGITVSRSGLVRAVDRASRHAQPTYAALRHQVRHSAVVTPDETGWKVAGRLNWLWVVATPQTTVYQIQPGRGYPEAANLLGKDFAGVIVRDGWAPYRRFTAASCLAIRAVWRTSYAGQRRCEPIIRTVTSSSRSRPRCNRPSACATSSAPAHAHLPAATKPSQRWPPASPNASPIPGHSPTFDASPTTSAPNGLRCSASCATPPSTPPTGALSRPSAPLSSPAKFAAAIAPGEAQTPSKSSPPSSAPPHSAGLTPMP